jgi:hypothetical protein
MLDLSLFGIRNFAVANLTTLASYAGLIGGLFFVGLFLRQVLGCTALEAGLAATSISILLFVLSPRFGELVSGVGPWLPITVGPNEPAARRGRLRLDRGLPPRGRAGGAAHDRRRPSLGDRDRESPQARRRGIGAAARIELRRVHAQIATVASGYSSPWRFGRSRNL